jgi:hypothetical protein
MTLLMMPAVSKSAAAYLLEQSLLFDGAAYLSRTPSVAGNRKTWTYSVWVKGSNLGILLGHRVDGSNYDVITFGNVSVWGGFIQLDSQTAGTNCRLQSSALFRDPSAWYHIVVSVDTTQATAANRVKFYVNGTEITAFGTSTYPSLNFDFTYINNTVQHGLGTEGGSPNTYFSGLMALPILVDGAALDATSFGELDDDGYWNPIEFAGDYNVLGSTPTVSSASALWTGNTATWTFTDDDISGPTGTDAAIRIMDYAFSDDFSVQWTHRAATNSSYTIGVYPTASDASFNAATYYAGVFYSPGLATSFSVRFDSETTYSLWGGNSAEQSSLAAADNDVMKFERVGSTFKVYKNAALIRTMTFTSTSQMRIALGRGAVCDMENVTFDYEIVDGVNGGAYDFADNSWFGKNVAGNDDQAALSASTQGSGDYDEQGSAWTVGSGTLSRTTTVNAIRSNRVLTGDFSISITMASGATSARVGVYAANEDGTYSYASAGAAGGMDSMTNSFYSNFGGGLFYKGSTSTVSVSQTNGAITITRVSGTITINTAGGNHTFAATYTGPMRFAISGGGTTASYTGIAFTSDGQAGNSFFDTGFVAADQLADTPTDDADLGIGNQATLDPNRVQPNATIGNNNRRVTASDVTVAGNSIASTIGGLNSGKWFWYTSLASFAADSGSGIFDGDLDFLSMAPNSGSVNNYGAALDTTTYMRRYAGGSSVAPDVSLGFTADLSNDKAVYALDADNGYFWAGIYDANANTIYWIDNANNDMTGDPTDGGTTGKAISGNNWTPFAWSTSSSAAGIDVYFGHEDFPGTIPTDFKEIATQNLPITHPLYTGTAAQYRAGTQVQSDALGSDSIGGATQSMRVVIPASAIADQSATRVRLKLKAASSQAFDTSHLYFGTNATGGSNAWDFTGDQVQVSVNGSTTISVAAGASVYSDWFTFACDGTDPLCAAWLFAATGGGTAYAATSGYTRYYKVSGTSSTDASATSPSGFTAQSNYFMLIAAIEVQ